MGVAGEQMICARLPREENEINRTPLHAHGRNRQRRAVAVFYEKNQFARAHQIFQRHGKIFRRRLAFDRDAIDRALADGFFADGVFGHFRDGDRNLAHKKRFGGFNLDGGDAQIRRAEAQREPRFSGIFVTFGDRGRNQFSGRRLAVAAWTSAPVKGTGCERSSSTVRRSHFEEAGGNEIRK